MMCKCVLLALFVAQVGAAGICAKESDYMPAHVYEVECKGVSKEACKNGAIWDDNKCKAQWSVLAGHTKADGSELAAICASISVLEIPLLSTCAGTVNFAMSGFKADATTCAATNAKISQTNSFATGYIAGFGCCGAGKDSCGAFEKSLAVCGKTSDFKRDKVAKIGCTVSQDKCVGLNTKWDENDKKCEISSSPSNKDDGTDLAALCKSIGGTVSTSTKCGFFASHTMKGFTKADATTCAATGSVGQPNSFMTNYLSRLGCCGTAQDSCGSLSGFGLCQKSADYKPHAVIEVKCQIEAANCKGTVKEVKFEMKDEGGKKMCKGQAQDAGADAAAVCKEKGGVPFGDVTTCSQWVTHFTASLKTQDDATCAAKNAAVSSMTNTAMSTYVANKGCCANGGATCCGDLKACLAAATPTASGALPAHATGVLVKMVAAFTAFLAIR